MIGGPEEATAPFPLSRFPPPFSCSLAIPAPIDQQQPAWFSLPRIEAEVIQTGLPPCAGTMVCLRSSSSRLSSHVAYSLVC